MSQHKFNITTADANTGAAMRTQINSALQALAGNSSGAAEPATIYAYQPWADITSGILKQRNAGNTAWISIRKLDNSQIYVGDGTAAAPGIAFSDGGIYRIGANNLGVAVNGVKALDIGVNTLTVTGIVTATGGLVQLDAGNVRSIITNNGAVATWGTSTNHELSILTNNIERLRISSVGLIGVGMITASGSAGLLAVNSRDTNTYSAGWYSTSIATGLKLDLANGGNVAIFDSSGLGLASATKIAIGNQKILTATDASYTRIFLGTGGLIVRDQLDANTYAHFTINGFTVGGFGCNGASAQAAYAVNAAATDAASTQALCNQLRVALINNGICV